MKYLRILEIQPGGWLLLSLLYFFLETDLLLVVLLCVLIHETGHLVMLDHFCVRVRRITLDLTGLTIHFNEAQLYGLKGCVAAAAGPTAGISAAVICSFVGNLLEAEWLLLCAGGNLALSLFNLLPAKPLDGWRILYSLFPIGSQVVSVCTAIFVLFAGLVLMFEGYGTAGALMGILLLLQEAPQHIRPIRSFVQ